MADADSPTRPTVAETFLEAADAFVAVACSVEVGRLGEPATGAWSLRELLAHATRGILTVDSTLDAAVDPSTRELVDAADYFATALSAPGVHDGIEQRALDGAAALGDAPGPYAVEALAVVRPRVASAREDRIVQHVVGRIAFGEYLATRVVELTLHTVDVQLALGGPVAFPAAASALTRDVLVRLVDRADALGVARALSGRSAGSRCDVLG